MGRLRPDILSDLFKVTLMSEQQVWDCWKLVVFSPAPPTASIMSWQQLKAPGAKWLLIATI